MMELNEKVKEKDAMIEALRSEMNDYNSIIESFKIDFETNNNLNDKKVNTLRSNIE